MLVNSGLYFSLKISKNLQIIPNFIKSIYCFKVTKPTFIKCSHFIHKKEYELYSTIPLCGDTFGFPICCYQNFSCQQHIIYQHFIHISYISPNKAVLNRKPSPLFRYPLYNLKIICQKGCNLTQKPQKAALCLPHLQQTSQCWIHFTQLLCRIIPMML